MRNKFTTAAKILLALFLLVIIILAFYFLVHENSRMFWTFLAYGAIIAILYGVIMEMSDNIYDIGENQRTILEKLNELSKQTKNTSSATESASPRYFSGTRNASTWICKCGRENSSAVRTCACGRQKPSSSPVASSTSGIKEPVTLVFDDAKTLDYDAPKILSHDEPFVDYEGVGLVKITEEAPVDEYIAPPLAPVDEEIIAAPIESMVLPSEPVEEVLPQPVEDVVLPQQPSTPPAPPEIELFKFCPVCGTRNANKWFFCQKCGKDLRKPDSFSL